MAWEAWKTCSPEGKFLWIGCSVMWFGLLLAAAWATDLNNPYLPFAIAGAIIFYLRSSPEMAEQLAWVVLSAAFALVLHFPQSQNWIVSGASVLDLFGLGAFAMLGWRWIWGEERGRRQAFAMLAPAASLVFFVFSAQRALSLANLFFPKTYDLYLYVADGSLGFQPSFVAGKAMAASAVLRIAALSAYLSLPLVMALVYALRLPKGTEKPSWDIITLLMMAGIAGWALYNIVPAAGPIYSFGPDFPWHSLPYRVLHRLFLERIPVPGTAPRNAMPSLHVAWVVLLYWNTKGLSRVLRIFLGVYLALTVISTLGTGEHYFVDLVAGVPFALFVQAIVSPGEKADLRRRTIAIVAGLAITFAWLLLVRFGVKGMLASRVVPWTLIVATLVGSWWLNFWFSSSANSPQLSAIPPAPPQALSAHA